MNRMINVITTLSDLLRESQEKIESSEKDRRLAVDGMNSFSDELDRVRKRFQEVQASYDELQRKLDLERRGHRSTETELELSRRNNVSLLLGIISQPEKFTAAITWLRQYDGPPDNKILAIKEVRQITGCGLKDAKDLCEAYWEHCLRTSLPCES